ncbi:MAG: hypothetical protein GY795_45325 [Desulfobacterales bacterium]|nr:hypothetical protein [Desulfobacterales bacterium]
MDKEKIKDVLIRVERMCDFGQELARSAWDKEPGQRSQNRYWREVKQDMNDIRKILDEE